MASSAIVLGLAVGPEGNSAPLAREPRERLELVAGQGVKGDKKLGKNPDRAVNLLSEQSYTWFQRSFGRELAMPGGLGEQVVISNAIDPAWLPLGARLQVGEALLEVFSPRKPCDHLAGTLKCGKDSYFVGHVGVMCRVLQGGVVRRGDTVTLLQGNC
ncbi:MAG: MOSC domain-containing protein [Planctomycetes bacterium]|nr:MOSC domain-containing protein [Planctomycetota bacterium]